MPLAVRRDRDRSLVSTLTRELRHSLAADATVAAHVPFGAEPAATCEPRLPEALAEVGFRVLLPVVLPDRDLDWAEYQGQTSLAYAPRGLSEPTGPRVGPSAIAAVDAVVAPAVAVDESGVRLGRGGGSYDRALARLAPGTPVIALLYDDELIRQLPTQPHDRRVTAVITPSAGRRDVG